MERFFKKVKRRVIYLLIRFFQTFRFLFYRCISTGIIRGKPVCNQPLLACGLGVVDFEERVVIGVFPSPCYLSTYAHIEARKVGSRIIIKKGTEINNNFCAIAEHTSITIGENCRIGANVEIIDSDFHGVSPNERNKSEPEWAKPVTIGDNVFIGSNVKILKGVTIGSDSIIANSSVVTRDISNRVIAGGNPARVIKLLENRS